VQTASSVVGHKVTSQISVDSGEFTEHFSRLTWTLLRNIVDIVLCDFLVCRVIVDSIMCRWITLLSTDEITLSDLVLTASNSLVKMSFNAGYHPGFGPTNNSLFNGDGFGVAWYHENGSNPALIRDVLPAWSDSNLREVCMATRSRCVVAHVRAASPGSVVSRENCHPFKAGRLTFCHNGRVDGFWLIRRALLADLTDEAFLSIGGTTDSEATFAMILSNLQRDGTTEETPLDQREPFGHERLVNAIVKTIKQLKGYYDMDFPKSFCRRFSTLNFCITDGVSVVVSRYCDRNPHIPPPSLYFAYGKAAELHKALTHGAVSGDDGPGDGTDISKASVNKMVQEHMSKQKSFLEFEHCVDVWEEMDPSNNAFVVSSDPLTYCNQLWHPIPSNSLMYFRSGTMPGLIRMDEENGSVSLEEVTGPSAVSVEQ
jgi:predicted glutamine amidotransferase